MLRLSISADSFHKLLVHTCALHDIDSTTAFHHLEKVWAVKVVHYGDDRE